MSDEAKRPLKGALSNRQIRMAQSIADFQMALSAIDFLCELDDDQPISRIERRRYRCFEDTATIAYWRPFSPAKGLPLLSFKQLGITPTAEQTALHKKIEDHRNMVIAHSDASRMRILFAAEKVLDDRDVLLPFLDFDDGLILFPDRWRWMDLVRTLIHAASKTLFDGVQGGSSIRFVRDWLHHGDPMPEEG
ncbi:MAG: hypothetical protein JWL84_1765 [Rhodospirillales bacterium]|nr:hypothetical protein [Rhodospirillales bacterium]